jgi:hypothetical protein
MLAVAAGIVATSIAEKRDAAFALAYVFAAILCLAPTQERWWRPYAAGFVIVRTSVPFPASGFVPSGIVYLPNSPPGQIVTFNVIPPRFGPITSAFVRTSRISLSSLAECFLVALLILWAAIRFAGHCIKRTWTDRLSSVRRENWVRRYCSPIGKESFARSMRRALEWNPVFWLQQYSWKARVTTWTLCLGFVALGCCVTNGANSRMIGEWEWKLMVVLAVVYTYAGVNGFYQEKKNGALELLLVTPVSVDELIFGRVFGLWKRFLPTALLMVLWCVMTEQTAFSTGDWERDALFGGSLDLGKWIGHLRLYWSDAKCALLAGYFTFPFFATFCALRTSNIVMATAYTWLLALAGPLFGVVTLAFLGPAARGSPMLVYVGIVLGNAVLVWFIFNALRDNLTRRIYNF